MPENITTWVTAEVIRAVSEIQVQSGRQERDVDVRIVPLLHLEGFDSLNCLEASVLLSERLGVEVEHNVFASNRGQPHSCEEIAKVIVMMYGPKLAMPAGEAV